MSPATRDEVLSPEFWMSRWSAAAAASRAAGGYLSRRIWDRMAADYGRWRAGSLGRDAASEELVSSLAGRGMFREGMRVLDVGCGTGEMAACFAWHGAEVVALDFSEGMLRRLGKDLPAELKVRVLPVEADWGEVDLAERGWEGAFDLAFAAMTPAIRTPEAFLKLHRASRGACYFRGWAGFREDGLLEGVWKHLTGKPKESQPGVDGVFAAFNLLYAMGLPASVEFQEIGWEKRESVEQATDFLVEYFEGSSGIGPDGLRGKIAGYLEGIAENGTVISRTRGRTGSLTWKVA